MPFFLRVFLDASLESLFYSFLWQMWWWLLMCVYVAVHSAFVFPRLSFPAFVSGWSIVMPWRGFHASLPFILSCGSIAALFVSRGHGVGSGSCFFSFQCVICQSVSSLYRCACLFVYALQARVL
jgi:hypothetical protein